MGWFSIELATINLVLNALVEYKFCVLFFSCFSIFHNSIQSKGRSFSWTATNGAHTHDFKIVSLTRCRLRHGHVHCLLILWLFLSAPNLLVSAQKFSFFLPKLIKNINWTVFMWTSLAFVTFFLRDCGKLWCFKGLIFNWTNNNQFGSEWVSWLFI